MKALVSYANRAFSNQLSNYVVHKIIIIWVSFLKKLYIGIFQHKNLLQFCCCSEAMHLLLVIFKYAGQYILSFLINIL